MVKSMVKYGRHFFHKLQSEQENYFQTFNMSFGILNFSYTSTFQNPSHRQGPDRRIIIQILPVTAAILS